MRKNKGPNTKPCGTPTFLQILQVWLFKITLWRLLWRNDSIISRKLPLIPLSLVYTEDLRAKLCQMHLISLRRHHKLLMIN